MLRLDDKRKVIQMKYIAKYWLSKHKYLAVLDDALVIVTTDDNGKDIRWCIFGAKEGD